MKELNLTEIKKMARYPKFKILSPFILDTVPHCYKSL